MRDEPAAATILDLVGETIRTVLVPALAGPAAYQARIAAHLVDLVGRELAIGATDDAAEAASLRALLGRDGDLAELNRALAAELRSGRRTCDDLAVAGHLRRTAAAKLAIDQPRWPRRLIEDPPGG